MAGGRNGSWKDTAFSIKVKKKLLTRGMSITDLAEQIGVNQSYVSQVLYGVKPGGRCMQKIIVELGMKEERGQAVGE